MPDGFEPGELVEVTVIGRIVHARKWEWTRLIETVEGAEFMAPPHARLTRIHPRPVEQAAEAADYQPGEIVDVAIKGVRVVVENAHGVVIADDRGQHHLMPPQAAITRIAPAEWPPQIGDLWRDRFGVVYLAADVHDIEETDEPEILLVCAHEGYQQTPETIQRISGPLTLVHREQPDGGEAP